MINLLKRYLGPREIERTSSPYNKEIVVIDDRGRIRILVGGLTQSGQFVQAIWEKAINHLKIKKVSARSCLILGFGGGTAANIVNQAWPKAFISGVEIDPHMIELGKKYLKLPQKKNLHLIIGDVTQEIDKIKAQFDLILVDVYHGGEMPQSIKSPQFVKKLFSHLNPGGTIIFNLLFYTDRTRDDARKYIRLIEKYAQVKLLRELTNLLVVSESKTFSDA